MPSLPLNSAQIIELAHLISGQTTPDCIQEDHWAELIELALDNGVGGMLLWSSRQSGWTLPDQSEWKRLLYSVRHNGLRSMLLEKVRWQVASAFDHAKIPAIWLKGIALAYTHYPQPYLRPMADLDVLVPMGQLALARDVLRGLNFQPAEIDFFELVKFTDQARHHECFLDRSGKVKLDLHFRLLVPSILNHLDEKEMNWFWTQTEELTLDGPSFRILKPDANLLYLCAHVILQNQGEPLDLLHLLDLHILLTQSPLHWDLIEHQASVLHWTDAVGQAVGLLPALFGTQLPDKMPMAFLQAGMDKEQLLYNLNPLINTRRWDDWRSAYGRMNIFQRVRLIWLTLFPPEIYIRKLYHLSHSQLILPYYVQHFLDGGREMIRALVGIH